MKICKLKLKNLNSFRESVDIDFENPPLDDASLVAITGPTGAGKTDVVRCDLRRTLREDTSLEWNWQPKPEPPH